MIFNGRLVEMAFMLIEGESGGFFSWMGSGKGFVVFELEFEYSLVFISFHDKLIFICMIFIH